MGKLAEDEWPEGYGLTRADTLIVPALESETPTDQMVQAHCDYTLPATWMELPWP